MKNEVSKHELEKNINILTKLVNEDEEVFGATLAQTLRVMLYDSSKSISLLNTWSTR